ncbi:MAG: glycosyltransferase [Rhizomicrobium sp.]
MKILHVITGIGAGGAETALCRLVESLRPPDYEHFVVALNAAGVNGSQSGRVGAAGASLASLDLRPSAPNPLALLRLRRLAKSWAPDVVHGWMYHANLAAALACGSVPLVWSIRQTLYKNNREKPLTWLVIRAGAWLSFRPRAIVYNARLSALQHTAYGYRSHRARVIDNGIDVDAFRPDASSRLAVRAELGIPERAFVLGHFAHWRPMKDHANAVKAAAQLVRMHPEAVFVFAGEGMDTRNNELTALIAGHGLAGNVRLCGRRSDMARIMAAVDLGYSSSAWGEAFSNAIAETMACGVPCVATDVGAAREIIGDCGIVVPRSAPTDLCGAWRTILNMDSNTKRAWSERARARIAKHYSIGSCAGAYARLYGELCEQPGRIGR